MAKPVTNFALTLPVGVEIYQNGRTAMVGPVNILSANHKSTLTLLADELRRVIIEIDKQRAIAPLNKA